MAARTPAIIERLNRAITEVAHRPEFRDWLIAQGTDPVIMGPQEFRRYIASETAKWGEVMKTAGVELQ